MKVTELMSTKVNTCLPEDSLREAAVRMLKHDCGILPVVDEQGQVLGMISDRDICMCSLIEGGALEGLHVSRAMSKEVWGLRPEDTFTDACKALKLHGVRRLPVMDEQHHLLGILGIGDLVTATQTKKKGVAARDLLDTLGALTKEPDPAAKPAAMPAKL